MRFRLDWALARISISNSQKDVYEHAQIWLQNLIKFHSKRILLPFFFHSFKAHFEGPHATRITAQSAQWNTWHNKRSRCCCSSKVRRPKWSTHRFLHSPHKGKARKNHTAQLGYEGEGEKESKGLLHHHVLDRLVAWFHGYNFKRFAWQSQLVYCLLLDFWMEDDILREGETLIAVAWIIKQTFE